MGAGLAICARGVGKHQRSRRIQPPDQTLREPPAKDPGKLTDGRHPIRTDTHNIGFQSMLRGPRRHRNDLCLAHEQQEGART